MNVTGTATRIKDRMLSNSSAVIHLETTKANERSVSFKATDGELKIGDDAYSITGGKANLAVKSGRLGMTLVLEDGKAQLLRITAKLGDTLPHEGDDPATTSFKVAKALRFWKLDMKGEMALLAP